MLLWTYLWEVTLRIAYQQTGLSTATITNHYKLFGERGRLGDICCFGHPSAGETGACAGSAVAHSHAVAARSAVTRCQGWRRGGKRAATRSSIVLVLVHSTHGGEVDTWNVVPRLQVKY